MWPRVVEMLLGIWLVTSPFVFGVGGRSFWGALGGGSLVVLFSVAAWRGEFGGARYLTLIAAIGIGGGVYLASSHPVPGFQQSAFLTAILLAMFAIIPNRCNRPPEGWRR